MNATASKLKDRLQRLKSRYAAWQVANLLASHCQSKVDARQSHPVDDHLPVSPAMPD
jgi:hypothetical protein